MTTRAYVKCCPECGVTESLWCTKCTRCSDCCDCSALFDADELGIDPEVDAARFERA